MGAVWTRLFPAREAGCLVGILLHLRGSLRRQKPRYGCLRLSTPTHSSNPPPTFLAPILPRPSRPVHPRSWLTWPATSGCMHARQCAAELHFCRLSEPGFSSAPRWQERAWPGFRFTQPRLRWRSLKRTNRRSCAVTQAICRPDPAPWNRTSVPVLGPATDTVAPSSRKTYKLPL